MPAARPKTSARVLTSLENIKIMEEKERQKRVPHMRASVSNQDLKESYTFLI